MPTAVIISSSNHVCPMFDGNKPHVGGPCMEGSQTVFVEGKPTCRVGDKLKCNSPSQPMIQSGSMTVFIDGKAAAIAPGSMTSHGGQIILGGSTTVFIY